jgi:hypothetical protein
MKTQGEIHADFYEHRNIYLPPDGCRLMPVTRQRKPTPVKKMERPEKKKDKKPQKLKG